MSVAMMAGVDQIRDVIAFPKTQRGQDLLVDAPSAVTEQHPNAGVVPEAVFFTGVADYWNSHDPKGLRRAYDTLTARFPQSEWARRALPYGQIPL